MDASADLLLHRLRLRGMTADEHDPEADGLVDAGLAVRRGERLALTPHGRTEAEARARLAPGSDGAARAERAYAAFLPLNGELIRACSDWQVRPGGTANDHRDARYDWNVIDRIGSVDERVAPVLRRLGREVGRFAGYRGRLATALERVHDGERDFVLSPRVDSYHTVWMELHEDLLLALGRSRDEEAAP